MKQGLLWTLELLLKQINDFFLNRFTEINKMNELIN